MLVDEGFVRLLVDEGFVLLLVDEGFVLLLVDEGFVLLLVDWFGDPPGTLTKGPLEPISRKIVRFGTCTVHVRYMCGSRVETWISRMAGLMAPPGSSPKVFWS